MNTRGRAYAHRIPLARLKCLSEKRRRDGIVVGEDMQEVIVAIAFARKWRSRGVGRISSGTENWYVVFRGPALPQAALAVCHCVQNAPAMIAARFFGPASEMEYNAHNHCLGFVESARQRGFSLYSAYLP